jgi:hypothetical protein
MKTEDLPVTLQIQSCRHCHVDSGTAADINDFGYNQGVFFRVIGGVFAADGSVTTHLEDPARSWQVASFRDLSAGPGLIFDHLDTRRLTGLPEDIDILRVAKRPQNLTSESSIKDT